jgi:NAD(P)-dependent dehydrogenase (short-subunit alcohol dehydrogenase family)
MSAADSGRAALVTGANRGLGLETSRQLLDRSLRVVMTGRDERALQRATGTLGAGDRALALRMDVSTELLRDGVGCGLDAGGAVTTCSRFRPTSATETAAPSSRWSTSRAHH